MNQGKLEVVKQEMATVNIDILGISELKLTGRGECKADDHDIYYCGQESHRKNGVVYAPTSYAKEAEVEWFYEDIQNPLELTSKKKCPFHYWGLESKSRKPRNTWNNRQIWPWSTE